MYLIDKLPALCPEGEVDDVGRALLQTADVLRRDGWCICSFTDKAGRHCVNGAFERARLPYDIEARAKERLATWLALPTQLRTGEEVGPGAALIFWNDDRHRTAEQVISALTRAAYAKG